MPVSRIRRLRGWMHQSGSSRFESLRAFLRPTMSFHALHPTSLRTRLLNAGRISVYPYFSPADDTSGACLISSSLIYGARQKHRGSAAWMGLWKSFATSEIDSFCRVKLTSIVGVCDTNLVQNVGHVQRFSDRKQNSQLDDAYCNNATKCASYQGQVASRDRECHCRPSRIKRHLPEYCS